MKIMKLLALGALANLCAVVACVSPRLHTQRHAPCEVDETGSLAITTERLEMAPGEAMQLPRPRLFVAPHVPPDTIASSCAVRWSVDSGAAIDSDGRLTIARDARPGSMVGVLARVGTLSAVQEVHVVDPAPNPLAATWSQDTAPVCTSGYRPEDAIVRELIFRRGGTFSVTSMPFESYRDYWGTYTYDALTARLTLVVEDGNRRPIFRTTQLAARIVDGALHLDGTTLAGGFHPSTVSGCRSVFKRLGDPR